MPLEFEQALKLAKDIWKWGYDTDSGIETSNGSAARYCSEWFVGKNGKIGVYIARTTYSNLGNSGGEETYALFLFVREDESSVYRNCPEIRDLFEYISNM